MKASKEVLTLLVVLLTVSSSQIRPLYAGTLVLEDHILRSNTCIFKTLPVPFTKAYYQGRNIGVVAAMAHLSIDQNFAYQFRYQILCPQKCFIDFVFSRYSLQVSKDFEYKMVIDFLVAENMMTEALNMTFYKTDISLRQLASFSSKSGLKNEAEDDVEVFLIPNGFNNVTKTGYLSHVVDRRLNKIIITFNDQPVSGGIVDFMGWKLNQNFIKFKVLLIPKAYIKRGSTCNPSKMFGGFLSAQLPTVKFQVGNHQTQSASQRQFELPIDCKAEFTDERILVVSQYGPKTQQSRSVIQGEYIFAIIPFLIAQVLYILYKKRMATTKDKGDKEIKLPDMLISFQTTQIVLTNEPKDMHNCQTRGTIAEEPIEADTQ